MVKNTDPQGGVIFCQLNRTIVLYLHPICHFLGLRTNSFHPIVKEGGSIKERVKLFWEPFIHGELPIPIVSLKKDSFEPMFNELTYYFAHVEFNPFDSPLGYSFSFFYIFLMTKIIMNI
jgi:hypothetical protein